ncbi:MAG: hypothetical protein ACLPTQ_14745 [Terriglobales bacterium]
MLIGCVLGMGAVVVGAQVARPQFIGDATVTQTDRKASIYANDPRPLDQAIRAIRRQYGWIVDYEDPSYGPNDLVDDTDAKWRKAHPDAKGVTRVAGGAFRVDLTLADDISSGSNGEQFLLHDLITQYNESGNRGRFELRRETPKRFSVVGIGAANGDVKPLLDTVITIPAEERTTIDSIRLVLRAISEKSGCKVEDGTGPINTLTASSKIGGQERPAREILSKLASATPLPLVWILLYDADNAMYFFNLDVATVLTGDSTRPAVPVSDK